MTNIATLFTVHPDAAGLLKGLYVMNGYFGEDALPDPYYNWNSWADPMASKIVFSSLVRDPSGHAVGGYGPSYRRSEAGGSSFPDRQ